jgi:hypothetical protein
MLPSIGSPTETSQPTSGRPSKLIKIIAKLWFRIVTFLRFAVTGVRRACHPKAGKEAALVITSNKPSTVKRLEVCPSS